MTIKDYCIEIKNLLLDNNEIDWAKLFGMAVSRPNFPTHEDLKQIIKLYSGYNSFNDVVLHKNGIPLVIENEKLDTLRSDLYKAIIKQIQTQSGYQS